MRLFLAICTAALVSLGTLPAQASPAVKAGDRSSATELSAATAKQKATKKPAKKKKEKIEYMRAAS